MGVRIKPGELAIEISKIYEEYSDEVVQILPEAVEKAVKVCKKTLKAKAPAKTGKYRNSFKSKKTKNSSSGVTIEVYSSTPGLPHVLEYGHVIKNQYGTYGMTRAFPHWAPAEEEANEALEKEIQKKIEEAG